MNKTEINMENKTIILTDFFNTRNLIKNLKNNFSNLLKQRNASTWTQCLHAADPTNGHIVILPL
jgi:hypothetical protein